MMNYPLLVPRMLERASTFFPDKEIVTREGESTHRYTYRDLAGRAARLSNALRDLGVGQGDRVGTFGWNTFRHLEAYFAPALLGAVVHTINIRLVADDLVYIINHAADKVILVDPDLAPILEALAPQLESVEHFVVMTDDRDFTTSLPSAHNYEELLERAPAEYLSAMWFWPSSPCSTPIAGARLSRRRWSGPSRCCRESGPPPKLFAS